ncbi:MAG TPA: DUF4190 domain-containing protein [Nocardioides sp.]|nr:DUF4190 domain-containing protein [Nocardioides sp.]
MTDQNSVPTRPPSPPPIDHPRGTVVLVLGILSLILCAPLGIISWILGRSALKEIDQSPGRYGNRGLMKAGMICGIIGTCLLAVVIIPVGVLVTVFTLHGVSTQGDDARCRAEMETVAVAEEANYAQYDTYTDVPGLVAHGLLVTPPTDVIVDAATGSVSGTGDCAGVTP